MTRSLLKALARCLVGVLVAAQMVIAAYACPALLAPSAADGQMPPASTLADGRSADNAVPMTAASNCDEMAGSLDPASPNLCAEHCKYGQQSDHAATLNAPVAVLMALYEMPPVPETALPRRPAAATLSALVAASPPHAVLHCVYRI